MFALFRPFFLLLSLTLVCIQKVEADPQRLIKNNPSRYLSNEVWEQVQEYLLPEDHPTKGILDRIFSSSRALANEEAMLEAGFYPVKPQHFTKIVVTRHPELPGYIIKAYLDNITPRYNKPDYFYLMKRAQGARLIQQSITAHHYEHLFKVPQKWLYLLPDHPLPSKSYRQQRKMFILIENDMDIVSDQKNEKLWKSSRVTTELLDAMYVITTELCLSDSTKPANCPFSRDGKVAFVDTQVFLTSQMKYDKLTPYLSPSMQAYWKKLIKMKGNIISEFGQFELDPVDQIEFDWSLLEIE